MHLGHLFGLGALSTLRNVRTRSISAENPTGSPGGGAHAEPDRWNKARRLGKGWKVRPAIGLEPHATNLLADIEGPGIIQHIWITCEPRALRSTVLRMTWDDAPHPAVEVPLGDFFANGHGLRYDVTSLPVVVAPGGGMNAYWPMPFRKRARIEVHSDLDEKFWGFFYQITYALTEVPDDAALFHAQWRRAITDRSAPEHVILDGVRGQGHYVGTHLSWIQRSPGWWGEGEVKFFIDGDPPQHPTICGTGTEDYVGGAWGFDGRTFSAPFFGYPLHRVAPGHPPLHAMYRWHVPDPICFEQDLRVTVQAIGLDADELYRFLDDDLASVAYWYQREPYGPFPPMPPEHERRILP